MWNNTDTPLAYFISFRSYGTWLHGDERGSIDRFNNCYGEPALHKKSESRGRSAKGAEYDSQVQALSNAKRVAPGFEISIPGSTESAKYRR